MAEVVSEALVSELSAPASHRLDAITEDRQSCVDVRNQFHLFRTLVDIESPRKHSNNSRSGITSANVKIIIADVDSTLNVGQHFTIYFSTLFVLVAFVHTPSDVHDVFLLRLPGILLSLALS